MTAPVRAASSAGAPTGHPLAATYDRTRALHPILTARVGSLPAGARTVAELAGDRAALADAVARSCAERGTSDAAVGASLWLHGVAWKVLGPAIGGLLAERRVPVLGPDAVALPDAGFGGAVVLLEPEVAVLAADPAAGHPAARVALPALLPALLRQGALAALAPLVEVLPAHARRGPRALWGLVADVVASCAQLVGAAVGDARVGRDVADLVLDGTPPLTGRGNWDAAGADDGAAVRRVRNACCLAYRLADHGYCGTCPLNRSPAPGAG